MEAIAGAGAGAVAVAVVVAVALALAVAPVPIVLCEQLVRVELAVYDHGLCPVEPLITVVFIALDPLVIIGDVLRALDVLIRSRRGTTISYEDRLASVVTVPVYDITSYPPTILRRRVLDDPVEVDRSYRLAAPTTGLAEGLASPCLILPCSL